MASRAAHRGQKGTHDITIPHHKNLESLCYGLGLEKKAQLLDGIGSGCFKTFYLNLHSDVLLQTKTRSWPQLSQVEQVLINKTRGGRTNLGSMATWGGPE